MSTSVKVIFGDVSPTTLTGTDIRDASAVEQFDPLSITLPISTLELLIYSEDADFSILNPAGNYEDLSEGIPLEVYAVIESVDYYMGRYYLDDWDNESDKLIRLKCIDIIGIMDSLDYLGGIWLTPISAADLIDELLTDLDIDYEIDPDIADVNLTGWLPMCSYREALQQVAFACGAYVLSPRQDELKIGFVSTLGIITKGIRTGVPATGQTRVWQKRWRTSQWEGIDGIVHIPYESQSMATKVNLLPLVTSLEISMHDIVLGTGIKKLFEETLSAGNHLITFDQPMHSLSASGATISESGANYALLNVGTAGTVLLVGVVYIDTVSVYDLEIVSSPPKENVVQVKEATMVNLRNGSIIGGRLSTYFQMRHTINTRYYVPDVKVGSHVMQETDYDQQINGMIEKMTVNLSGGFVADAYIVGKVEEE